MRVFIPHYVSESSKGLDTQIDVSPYISDDTERKTQHGCNFIDYKIPALSRKEDPNARRVENLSVLSRISRLRCVSELAPLEVFT